MGLDDLKTDFSLVEDKGADAHPAWPAFKKEMEGRCYGWNAVNAAWAWFKAGWDASTQQPPSSTQGDRR